jgi:hypothetical protein
MLFLRPPVPMRANIGVVAIFVIVGKGAKRSHETARAQNRNDGDV